MGMYYYMPWTPQKNDTNDENDKDDENGEDDEADKNGEGDEGDEDDDGSGDDEEEAQERAFVVVTAVARGAVDPADTASSAIMRPHNGGAVITSGGERRR